MSRSKIAAYDGQSIDIYSKDNVYKASLYVDENGSLVVTGTGAGNDVIIGAVGVPADLIFEENSTISAQGTNTVTVGVNGDTFNLDVDGVTYKIDLSDSTSSYLILPKYSDNPSTPRESQIFYNSTTKKLSYYNGTEYVSCNTSNDGNNLLLGTPTDGDWTSGIGNFNSSTSITEAIDFHDEILSLIAPAKAGLLTSQALTLSNTTKYTVKIPSGLPAAWYADSISAGASVTDYVIDNSFTLTSPITSTSFHNGMYNSPQGTLELLIDDVSSSSISTTTTGNNGTLYISSVATYNSIWSKANAYANITQSSEGLKRYAFRHTLAGTSSVTNIRYDNSNPAATFASNPVVSELTPSWKYLSGIQYYGNGSTFKISFTANNLFNKAYNDTRVAAITMSPVGFATDNLNPGSVPAYTDQFVITDRTLTIANVVASLTPTITTTLYKATGTTVTYNNSLTKGVCSYGTVSTTTADTFFDEAQRLVLNTNTAWTSSNALTNGNAQVRCGTLQYPNTTEYNGFTGDQEYQRKFTKASASTGSITLTGVTYTQVSAYGSGDLNILLQLDTDGKFFDLGRPVGSNNGDGTGSSRANSLGGRSSGSGSVINFSFGTYSTANNSSQYRIIIIFKNSTRSITAITTA